MKNTKTEMKNTLEGINSTLDEAEDLISILEGKVAENTQSEQEQEKRTQENEDSLRDLWDNIKCTNICNIGVSEEDNKELKTYLKK